MSTADKISGQQLTREYRAQPTVIDEERRTVELAFSSETPVDRAFGSEVLDHAPSSVRLARLQNGGAVLVDHDSRDHVGVVESVRIDGDRIGRALVRFGRGVRASEIYQDVVDGIRQLVSVGYVIHRATREVIGDSAEQFRVLDWEPLEVSIVSVPADASVGVGRSQPEADEQSNTNPAEDAPAGAGDHTREVHTMSEQQKTPAPAIDINAERENWRKAESERVKEINGLAHLYPQVGEMARKAVEDGTGIDAFRAQALATIHNATPITTDAAIGLSDRESRSFSFLKAMRYLADPKSRSAREAAAFEIECSEAAAQRAKKQPEGILVPSDVLRRDLNVGTSTAGGNLVSTDLRPESFIDLLRNRLVLGQAGATTMMDLQGDLAIPKQTGGATAYWVAESAAPTESQQTVGQVTMSPKTVGAYTDYSRKLLLQSSIDVENFVRADLTRVLAIEIDRVGLYGTGSSNQPQGVKTVTGINNPGISSAGAPTWAEIRGFWSAIAQDNADAASMSWIIEPAMASALMGTDKGTDTGRFVMDEVARSIMGYQALITNQVTANDVFFGNWSDLLIGMWSGLDLLVDPYTGSASGTVRVTAHQDVDVAVRHGESFAYDA